MPVTFYPAGNKAEPLNQGFVATDRLLNDSYLAIHGNRSAVPKDIFVSSFTNDDAHRRLVPATNGFVGSVLEAYQRHRMLIVRPDDVWMAILSQFNFFVNKNAEQLRGLFVTHQGKKTLTLSTSIPSRYRIDVASAALRFTDLLHENITDPSVRDWIMPDFTTTTPLDKAVSAILMMSTFQKYFQYNMCGCGIPAVTLEGEKRDWESILRRIEKLKEYGIQTTAWYHLLRPVLKRFVAAFDGDANSAENRDFWNRVAHETALMSAGKNLSGWITAFCVFTKDGHWMGPRFNSDKYWEKIFPKDFDPELDPTAFSEKYLWKEKPNPFLNSRDRNTTPELVLDGVTYHHAWSIPPATAGVDITIVEDSGKKYSAAMVAGLTAYEVLSSKDMAHSQTGQSDTVKPVAGWWLFDKPVAEPKGDDDW